MKRKKEAKMNDAVRYELINVTYDDGSKDYKLLKIRNDGLDEDDSACDYVEEMMTFDMSDAAALLDEDLYHEAKEMTFDEFAVYYQTLDI